MFEDRSETKYSNYPKAARFGTQKRSTLAIRAAEMNNLDVFDELCKEAIAASKGSRQRINILHILATFIAPKLKLVQVQDALGEAQAVQWDKLPADLLREVRKHLLQQQDLSAAASDGNEPVN